MKKHLKPLKMYTHNKKNKGITLIAIVIIILLLILVRITITQLTVNGVLGKVKEGAKAITSNTIITYEPNGYTNKDSIKLLIKITNNKGIKSIKCADNDTIFPKNGQTQVGIDYTLTQNQTYTFVVTDNKDIEETKSIEVNIFDRVAPKDFTPIEVEVTTTSVKIRGNAEDGEETQESAKSGIAKYEYYVDGEKKGESEKEEFEITDLVTDKSYTIYLIAYDNAGNTKKSQEINVVPQEVIYIRNLEELKEFRDNVNNGDTYEGKWVKLINDINLNDISNYENWNEVAPENEWIPIGEGTTNGFSGKFDGGNHVISGMYISNDKDYQGLFAKITNAELENVTIEKGYISGNNFIGGIVGDTYNSNIENAKNINVIINGNNYVGGIAGSFLLGIDENITKKAKNCSNESNVKGNDYVGGIIGVVQSNTIRNNIKEPTNARGEVIKVYNLENKGNIEGSSRVGGLFGFMNANRGYIYFYNSYNMGNVLGKHYIGGCSGVLNSTNGWGGMHPCFNVGNLYNVGNVDGIEESGKVTESLGGIYGDSSCFARDGSAEMYIKNCYSLNNPNGTKQSTCESWGYQNTIIEENVLIKTESELKSLEFIELLNTQKEQDSSKYEMELNIWMQGDSSTKGYPKFE